MSEKIATLNEEVIKGLIREFVRGRGETDAGSKIRAQRSALGGTAAVITTEISQRLRET